MAFLHFTPFSLLFLAVFAILLSHNAEGMNPISLCKKTHNSKLCESIVKGATNAHDATINAIQFATNSSKNIHKLIPSIEKAAAKLPPAARGALVKLCKLNFEDAVSQLKTSIIFINRGGIDSAKSFLNGALSGTNECRDSVTAKVGDISALNKSIDRFNEVMDVTLSLANQIKI